MNSRVLDLSKLDNFFKKADLLGMDMRDIVRNLNEKYRDILEFSIKHHNSFSAYEEQSFDYIIIDNIINKDILRINLPYSKYFNYNDVFGPDCMYIFTKTHNVVSIGLPDELDSIDFRGNNWIHRFSRIFISKNTSLLNTDSLRDNSKYHDVTIIHGGKDNKAKVYKF